MSYKLSDFFVGINEFLGILVPGAILLFLQRQVLLSLFACELGEDAKTLWVAFFLGSYIVGHFLLAFGVPINRLLLLLPFGWFSVENDAFYEEAASYIDLPDGEETRSDAFHRAYSFVRLNNPAASADIERQVGDYQLFRSLVLVFALDLLCAGIRALLGTPSSPSRIVFSAVMLVLALGRFPFLLKWTYRTTFEYYTLLKRAQTREKSKQNA